MMAKSKTIFSDDPILRIQDVEREVGLSRSTIYASMKKLEFPASIKLGERASGWLLSEINDWKQQRIEATRQAREVLPND